MIAFENVSAKRKPFVVTNVSLVWEAGIHAVVGTPADGCALLLALVVGAARCNKGRLRVLGGSPTDANLRPQVARVGIEPSLPEAFRVDEALALAAILRGDPVRSPNERLAVLGLEALARRPVRSLSRGESRGVALAEAVTSARVRVLVVEEPFAWSDPEAAGRISEALREKGRKECVVVASTASLRDASEIADDYTLMRRGACAGPSLSLHAFSGFAPGGTSLAVVTRDAVGARALVAAIAREVDEGGETAGVEQEACTVKLRGPDPIALARVAGRAAVKANVEVVEIRGEPPSLEEAQASASGVAATYEASFARPRDALRPHESEPLAKGPA